MGQDRPDVQLATKQASHKMAIPTETDLPRLKRIERYFGRGRTSGLALHRERRRAGCSRVWTVIGFGCLSNGKSTSGGVLSVAGTAMKAWSSTQGSVATSVAETEYYAALKGAAEKIGFASFARNLGYELKVILWSDSTVARVIGLSNRIRFVVAGRTFEKAVGLGKSACQPF